MAIQINGLNLLYGTRSLDINCYRLYLYSGTYPGIFSSGLEGANNADSLKVSYFIKVAVDDLTILHIL